MGEFSAVQYRHVSPNGDNAAGTGSIDRPYKTWARAYLDLLAFPARGGPAQGGVIRIARGSMLSDGTEWPGISLDPSGRGRVWLRDDGWKLPGWQPLVNVRTTAWDVGDISQFGENVALLSLATDDTRLDRMSAPALWIGSTAAMHFEMERVGGRATVPCRIGWDYRRNNDGTIALGNITAAERKNPTSATTRDPSQGQTTLTLDFPAAWPITQMSRLANLTTARISLPAPAAANLPGPLWHTTLARGKWIHVDPGSGAGTFGAIDVQVAQDQDSVPKPLPGADSIEVKYKDPGMDVLVPLAVTGAGMSGHMLLPGDIVEVNSTDPQWPQTFYRVISSVNHNQVVVADPYGYGLRSLTHASSGGIGTYVLQCRSFGTSFDQWESCQFQTSFGFAPDGDRFNFGPTMDHAGSNAFGTRVIRGYYEGCGWDDGSSFHNGVRDPARAACWFVDSGASGACGIHFDGTRLAIGHVQYGGAVVGIDDFVARDIIQEAQTGKPSFSPYPCINVTTQLPRACRVMIDNCFNADAPASLPCAALGDISTGTVRNTTFSGGKGIVVLGPRDEGGSYQTTPNSYESQGVYGWERGGYLAGARWDAQAQFGIYQGLASISNVLPEDLSTWRRNPSGDHVNVTPGPSQDGSTSAWTLSSTGPNDSSIFATVPLPSAVALGDRFVVGLWVKAPPKGLGTNVGPAFIWLGLEKVPGDLSHTLAKGMLVRDSRDAPAGGEWQYLSRVGEVTDPTHVGLQSVTVNLFARQGQDYVIDGVFCISLPAAKWSRNDAFRLANTLRPPIPSYLPAGAVGPREGQKIYAPAGVKDQSGILVKLVAPQTNITFSGLDGDADGIYEILYYLLPTTAALVSLKPNNIADSTQKATLNLAGTTGHAVNALVIDNNAAGGILAGTLTFRSKTGTTRLYTDQHYREDNGGNTIGATAAGKWTDPSTVVTSIVIAGDFAAGSWALLRKLGSQ
jgi:hypothetical protein